MQNKDVFSEFSMFDFSLSNVGGMNLNIFRQDSLDITNETYQDCLWMALNVMSCVRIQSKTWPSNGVSIFRDTRLAVGRLRQSLVCGPGQPTTVSLASLCTRMNSASRTEYGYWKNQEDINEQVLELC